MSRGICLTACVVLVAALTSCKKEERASEGGGASATPYASRLRLVVGELADAARTLSTPCPKAATEFDKLVDKHGASMKKLKAASAGNAAARQAEQATMRTHGPAFRRFRKRCPAERSRLDKALAVLSGISPGAPLGARARVPAASSGGMELRPPRPEDLASYVKDLPGSGPLKAKIITSKGTFDCTLREKDKPMTVANFVGLARGLKPFRDPKTGKTVKRPFFDGIIFHRVIPNFMIQTGDPRGTGMGGPGYKFPNEIGSDNRHTGGGIMSMANAGPGTNGSQFFITERATHGLDPKHTVFGQCGPVSLVKEIARVPKRGDRPIQDVFIERVEISRGK